MTTPLLLQAKSPKKSSWVDCRGSTRLVISGRSPEDVFLVFTRRGDLIQRIPLDGASEIPIPARADKVRVLFAAGPSTVDVDLE